MYAAPSLPLPRALAMRLISGGTTPKAASAVWGSIAGAMPALASSPL